MPPSVVIVGSLNIDFVVQVKRLPTRGETTLGRNFRMVPGGKGANQACAVGRLGDQTLQARMIGRVGDDAFGAQLKASLSAAGVDTSGVGICETAATGVAFIPVEESGENSIIVAPGANHAIREDDVESFSDILRRATYALFQLETPIGIVESTIGLARRLGVQTILDPAPAQPLNESLLAQVDILTPNETEANLLLGREAASIKRGDERKVANELRAMGARAVLLKLGPRGCFYFDGDTELFVPAFPVNAVDTTAAGDIFNGGFAVALAEGLPLKDALRFANAASAVSVTRMGAQSSVPLRREVDAFLKSVAS